MDLPYKPPYDWESMSRFLAARAGRGVEIVDSHRYARTFEIDGTAGHARVTALPDRFDVALHFADQGAVPKIVARLRRLLDLDADPAMISSHLGKDAALHPLVSARPGLRLPGAWDGFELAVRAILGQQVSVAAATQLAGRLIAAFGQPYDAVWCVEGLTHLFPSAARLRNADIASIGMPKSRAASISALAAAALDDPTLFDDAQGVARLRSIPGIGEWTVQYIAMRALHDGDAFPAGDVALQRALANGEHRPNARQLETRAENWRPWRAYAAIHLWRGEAQ